MMSNSAKEIFHDLLVRVLQIYTKSCGGIVIREYKLRRFSQLFQNKNIFSKTCFCIARNSIKTALCIILHIGNIQSVISTPEFAINYIIGVVPLPLSGYRPILL